MATNAATITATTASSTPTGATTITVTGTDPPRGNAGKVQLVPVVARP
ncbi:hypothetical protein J2X36_005368 [Methylobacterium sp. BE186]|nr:hypothetical protein [Methylobacterium sp. BE186]